MSWRTEAPYTEERCGPGPYLSPREWINWVEWKINFHLMWQYHRWPTRAFLLLSVPVSLSVLVVLAIASSLTEKET